MGIRFGSKSVITVFRTSAVMV